MEPSSPPTSSMVPTKGQPSTQQPQSQRQRQQQQQQPTYTTAGTIYNRQGAPPIQPPTRRGRATRWPPPQSDLSFYPKQLLAGFHLKTPRSPPTTASSLQEYLPLQQNYDRATNPTTGLINQEEDGNGDQDFGYENRDTFYRRTDLTLTIPPYATMPPDGTHPRPLGFGDRDNTKSEDDTEYKLARSAVENVSFKTLSKISVFNQTMHGKAAQERLNRARLAITTEQDHHRPSTPGAIRQTNNDVDGGSMSGSTNHHGPYSRQPTNEGSHSSTVGDSAGYMQQYDGFGGQSELHRRAAKHGNTNGSALRYTTLASGPGAPQPLAAGPPGRRQYKPSTFEGPIRAIQESAQKSGQSIDEARPDTDPYPAFRHGRPTSTNASRPVSPYERKSLSYYDEDVVGRPNVSTRLAAAYPNVQVSHHTYEVLTDAAERLMSTLPVNTVQRYYTNGLLEIYDHQEIVPSSSHHSRGFITDTLPVDAVEKYYPNGLPDNYDPQRIVSVGSTWRYEYLITRPWIVSQEEQQLQDANIDEAFYAGGCGLGKTTDEALFETQMQYSNRQLGAIGCERRRERLTNNTTSSNQWA